MYELEGKLQGLYPTRCSVQESIEASLTDGHLDLFEKIQIIVSRKSVSLFNIREFILIFNPDLISYISSLWILSCPQSQKEYCILDICKLLWYLSVFFLQAGDAQPF